MLAFVGLPDRQAPFFEQVHGFVDVTAHVVGQVVAGDAHQVVGDHAGVVGGLLLADVGVDRGQTLRNGAGTVHGGLVDQLDLQVVANPALHLVSGAACGHAATDHENIDFEFHIVDSRSSLLIVCFPCNYLLAETS